MIIHYERTFRIAQYESERIGFEFDTNQDTLFDDGRQSLGNQLIIDTLRKIAERNFTARYPHLKEQLPTSPKAQEKISVKKELIDYIKECTTIQELETYFLLVKTPEQDIAYKEKLIQLQNS